MGRWHLAHKDDHSKKILIRSNTCSDLNGKENIIAYRNELNTEILNKHAKPARLSIKKLAVDLHL